MKLKAHLIRFIRWLLRTYKREIKRFVNEKIDEALKEVQKHANATVSRKIKNKVVKAIIIEKIDIYTTSGAEVVKGMVDDLVSKLEGGE